MKKEKKRERRNKKKKDSELGLRQVYYGKKCLRLNCSRNISPFRFGLFFMLRRLLRSIEQKREKESQRENMFV